MYCVSKKMYKAYNHKMYGAKITQTSYKFYLTDEVRCQDRGTHETPGTKKLLEIRNFLL